MRACVHGCVRVCAVACARSWLPACARPSNSQNYTETQRDAYYDIFICTAHSLQFPPYDTILIFYCTLTAASTVRHDVFFILTQHWTIFFARYTSAAYSFFYTAFYNILFYRRTEKLCSGHTLHGTFHYTMLLLRTPCTVPSLCKKFCSLCTLFLNAATRYCSLRLVRSNSVVTRR